MALGPLAPILTVGSMLISAGGGFMGQKYEQEQAKIRARVGEVRARDTESGYTEELNRTISTIKAIRASTGASPDSPSTAAVIGTETGRSDINRRREAGAERVAAEAARSDASFMGRLAGLTLLGGVAKAGGYALGSR